MHNRMTTRRRRPPGKTDAPQGNTLPAQGEKQEAVPRMPHERDESADSQQRMEPSNERMGRLGLKDAERGVADTTKGAELDATYEKLRKGTPDPEKKFRP